MTTIRLIIFAVAVLSFAGCSTAKDPFDAVPENTSDIHVAPAVKGDGTIEVQKAEETWVVSPDKSLHLTLNEWAKKANWNSVSWEIPGGGDYVFTQSGTITGTFEEAVKKLSLYMMKTDFKVRCEPHTGNKVLQVTLMEGSK